MRQALRTKGPRATTSGAVSTPPPVNGWNVVDPLADMGIKFARQLDNWFPTPHNVQLRKGWQQWVTGITGTVESLMPYNGGAAHKLFAAASTSFFDVTTQGTVGAAVQTGLTNARWQSVNVATAGGAFMYAVNGVDKPRLYDGTNWTAIDNASTPAITGVTTTLLSDVMIHQSRLWFIERNSLRVWYLPAGAIAGAAQSIDLGQVFRLGGTLVALDTWTLDAGYGMDDYAVFVTSEGEVAVYQGTDPASASTWKKVGTYIVGTPMGPRGLCKYAGDLSLICKDGVIPLSKALMSSRVSTQIALSKNIQYAVSMATSDYAPNFGWEVVFFPPANQLILNVPVSDSIIHQYVMNTITQAWCRWTGINAKCWAVSDDQLYFGKDGVVGLGWTGESDGFTAAGIAGSSIDATAKQAFNYFGDRTRLKHVKAVRPVLTTSGSIAINVGIDADFADSLIQSPAGFSVSDTYTWGGTTWGGGQWSGGNQVRRDWQAGQGIGYCHSMGIRTSSATSDIAWESTEWIVERGGLL